jgi:hypothetical protein
MANQSNFATVEQESPSCPPVLTAVDLTPAVAHSFEMVCLGYFEHKDIAEDKQVCKILAGLQDSQMQDWVSVDCDCFLALSFADFMKEFQPIQSLYPLKRSQTGCTFTRLEGASQSRPRFHHNVSAEISCIVWADIFERPSPHMNGVYILCDLGSIGDWPRV